jgi:hypothetical protein
VDGYAFYKIYHPLYLHFTTPYNVLKYRGKVKMLDRDSFEKLSNKGIFYGWGKKFDNAIHAGNVVLSNMIYNDYDDFVYRDKQDAIDIYYEWKKVKESSVEVLKRDCMGLVDHLKTLSTWQNFLKKTPSGKTAPLLQLYQHKKIHPESLIALDSIHPFIDDWKNDYAIDPLISERVFKLTKYRPFVKIDKNKVTNIFKEQIAENAHY